MADYRERLRNIREDRYLTQAELGKFHKAEKVCSNSQLYKQAGNSIVVDVLVGILGNLLGEDDQ